VVAGLLDTAVVVDLLRSFEPASRWLADQRDELGLSPVVWLEVLEGPENLRAQASAIELLRHFERVRVEPQDFDWAIEHQIDHRLRHGVDMMDCLIAATSHRLGVPLFTRNLKHFKPLLGAQARRPY